MGPRTSISPICLVIPAYRPPQNLTSLIEALVGECFHRIILVDDGSGSEYQSIFRTLSQLEQVTVVTHAVNLGKGAALKTGINRALVDCRDCIGVVTADADGQHDPSDIQLVAERMRSETDKLVLGTRQFGPDTPLRSRLGNNITRILFQAVHGVGLSDTQTGLRGLPASLCRLILPLESNGYEFELEILIAASRLRLGLVQLPIHTIYLDGNASSHFNPLFDSLKIYFVLFRYSAASLLTALVDNSIFYMVYLLHPSIAWAQIIGRLAALLVNFYANKRLVFLIRDSGHYTWIRYLSVVTISGSLSYVLLLSLQSALGLGTMPSKLLAESVLFVFNFMVLRDFVFTKRSEIPAATDWSAYYQAVPPTARLTRRYTTRKILESLRANGFSNILGESSILEFGGANSCFLEAIVSEFRPAEYDVADTNDFGLSLLKHKRVTECIVGTRREDVLRCELGKTYDLVFSVGLIEHFDQEGTSLAIESHLRHAKPGGLVLISFPRPTLLYRIARSVLETFGLWKFPDERALHPIEVTATLGRGSRVLFEKTLWPLILTQHVMLVRVTGPASVADHQ